MIAKDLQRANEETREAWEQNAAFWDEHIGEGNDFVEVLIWPATKRLLEMRPGECVLDAGCGNGLYARRLAAIGADVVAFDFSSELIERARARTTEHTEHLEYLVMDATDSWPASMQFLKSSVPTRCETRGQKPLPVKSYPRTRSP